MSLKAKLTAWLRTIHLLIKHWFNTTEALQETDRKYAEEVNRVISEIGPEADEYRN